MNPHAGVLFPVAVESNALLDFQDPDHKQTHVVAAQLLREYGILTYGPGDKQALHRAIRQLTGRPQRVWSGVVEYLTASRRADDQSRASLAEFLQSAAKLENSADVVRLAVIGKTSATLTKTSRPGSNTTEHVTLPDLDESQAVTDASNIGTFPARTSRSAIAEQLLKPLAARSTCVKIMDPHILEDLVSKDRRPAHVEWLLGVLGAAMPANSTISLIGTLQGTWRVNTQADAETRIERFVGHVLQTRNAPLTVKVQLAQALNPPLKNRFLWFDCGCSFDVLHNFTPLNAEPLREEVRFTRQDEATAKQTETLAACYESYCGTARVSVTRQLP